MFKTYTPHFKYCKIAENEYSKEQLVQIGNLVSTLFLAETQSSIEEVTTELLNLFNQEDRQAISLLLNWFSQLVIHGHREAIDYQALEQVYHSKEEAKTMLETAIERQRQLIYQQGEAKGEAVGWARGEAAGWAKGKTEGQAELIISLLEARFGSVDAEVKERINQLDSESLLNLSKKLWTVQSLEEI